jgi:putative DNA primase/helicase
MKTKTAMQELIEFNHPLFKSHRTSFEIVEELTNKMNELLSKENMEYLLLKSIEGLKRVLLNRTFTECDIVKDELVKYEESNNSVLAFLGDGGKFEDELISESYLAYTTWCLESGLKSFSKNRVGRELKRFDLESRIVKINNKTVKIYKKVESI